MAWTAGKIRGREEHLQDLPPLCSGYLVAYGGRLMRCEECSLTMDRDVVATINPQMRGAGLPQRALKREGLSRGNEIPPTST
jgi:transposase